MKDTEINIAIAEKCNHPFRPECTWHGCPCPHIPNYCHDLNAMAEAEETLPKSMLLTYDCQLGRLCEETDTFTHHATARQRAEAFLKTLGKWQP